MAYKLPKQCTENQERTMKFNPLDKTIVPLLRKSLEAYSTRHTAIAENISNVDTKGYRPLKVHFESELQRALEKNRPVAKKTDFLASLASPTVKNLIRI